MDGSIRDGIETWVVVVAGSGPVVVQQNVVAAHGTKEYVVVLLGMMEDGSQRQVEHMGRQQRQEEWQRQWHYWRQRPKQTQRQQQERH